MPLETIDLNFGYAVRRSDLCFGYDWKLINKLVLLNDMTCKLRFEIVFYLTRNAKREAFLSSTVVCTRCAAAAAFACIALDSA